MPTNVIMPLLGDSVVEATVSKWLKHEGDSIKSFEPLLEVSTDKVDSEIPAPSEGVLLKIYVKEGQTVEHGTLLALIGEAGEAPTHETPQAAARAPQSANGDSHPSASYTGHVTPVVARMVAEHGVDLSKITGTGREGRVTKKDVEAFLASDSPAVSEPPAAPVQPAVPPRLHPVEAVPAGTPGDLVPLSAMRKAIAEHMVRSKLQTSPHVTSVFEVDMSAVMAHREANKDAFARQGVNLTLTAYFVAATVDALRATPYLNAQWTNQGVYLHHTMNIGLAVALDDGLIVPVIKNAQDLNLMGLARAVNDLAARARNKQLKPEEVQGGTFTITNHGVSGSLFATPIINQPQVGILGVGVIEKRVKVITDAAGQDAIAIRPCVYVSITFDHRVVDGAAGDGFLLILKQRLENW